LRLCGHPTIRILASFRSGIIHRMLLAFHSLNPNGKAVGSKLIRPFWSSSCGQAWFVTYDLPHSHTTAATPLGTTRLNSTMTLIESMTEDAYYLLVSAIASNRSAPFQTTVTVTPKAPLFTPGSKILVEQYRMNSSRSVVETVGCRMTFPDCSPQRALRMHRSLRIWSATGRSTKAPSSKDLSKEEHRPVLEALSFSRSLSPLQAPQPSLRAAGDGHTGAPAPRYRDVDFPAPFQFSEVA
jgi:hypothetical protein